MIKTRLLPAFALFVAIAVPGVTPAADDTAPKSDNTRMNKEMRQDKEHGTADQQAENPADRTITQQIRQAVSKNKSLSTTAHNVKIITRDGMVSLKGPVKSEHEKSVVEQTAAKIAGEGKVTSELTVVPPKKK